MDDFPDNETNVPTRIAAAKIRKIFESLSGAYDETCREKCYPGAAVAQEVIRDSLDEGTELLRVLDIGCGTGLLGPTLRSRAAYLEGVDLCESMLNQARATGNYDSLYLADALEHLSQNQGNFDLIAAVGTFHYFGDLSGVLRASMEALRPHGLLVFTLASGPLMGEGYYHQPEGYFTHAPQYVMQQLGEMGICGGTIRRVPWPAADPHSEYALVVAVQRPEQLDSASQSSSPVD